MASHFRRYAAQFQSASDSIKGQDEPGDSTELDEFGAEAFFFYTGFVLTESALFDFATFLLKSIICIIKRTIIRLSATVQYIERNCASYSAL